MLHFSGSAILTRGKRNRILRESGISTELRDGMHIPPTFVDRHGGEARSFGATPLGPDYTT